MEGELLILAVFLAGATAGMWLVEGPVGRRWSQWREARIDRAWDGPSERGLR